MTPDWLIAVLSGVGAALIAVPGPVIVYARSRRRQLEDAARNRTDAAVADVLGAAQQVTSQLGLSRWQPANRQLLELVAASTRFVATELRDHPEVSIWAMDEVRRVSSDLAEVERLRWRSGHRYIAAVEDATGRLATFTADFLLWHQGVRGVEHYRGINETRRTNR
jgi:hypothetical protein